jgi:tRNA 2-thiouridine synthesizing protein E
MVTEQAIRRQLCCVAGHEVYFDSEGFFWEPNDWTEDVAAELAFRSGIEELDDSQWRVIRFLREYYQYQGRAPMNRELKAGTGLTLVELERMFPEGIKFGARRLAGLPNPRTCLD